MIEYVEELGAILQAPALGKPNVLLQREVDIECPGADQNIAARIPECPRGIGLEGFGGEPLGNPLAARPARVAGLGDQVGHIIPNAAKGVVLTRRDRQREAALPIPDPTGLPTP